MRQFWIWQKAFKSNQFEGKQKRTKGWSGCSLSGLIFIIVFEKGLKSLNKDKGFDIGDVHVQYASAYSDDNLLYATTRRGLKPNVDLKSKAEGEVGLTTENKSC